MVNSELRERMMNGISYTIAMNYNTCRYRAYLMLTTKESLVFPEQLRGLLMHKIAEHVFRDEPIPTLNEMYKRVMRLDRQDVVKKRIMEWGDRDRCEYVDRLKKELRRFADACRLYKQQLIEEGYEVVSVEKEFQLTLTAEAPPCSVEVVIHPDLVLRHPQWGLIVMDIKTGRDYKSALYSSKQLPLYAAVVEQVFGEKCTHIGVIRWDGYALSHELRPISDFEKMEVLGYAGATHLRIRRSLERLDSGAAPHRAFHPNTKTPFCRPNTCSYFHMCEYGQRKWGCDSDE